MELNKQFSELASQERIDKAVTALKDKGFNAMVFDDIGQAREKIFNLIPEEAEVMNMSSVTLDQMGINEMIVNSGRYKAVREEISTLNNKGEKIESKRAGMAHEWVVGSCQAITEDGAIIISSNTGSQLGAYAYGADNIILVVGSQKIVSNLDEGLKRIYEYCLVLEDERSKKVYGSGSSVNKVLILNNEVVSNRINIIIVKEKLGY